MDDSRGMHHGGDVPVATIGVDLDPVDVHLRGYGHDDAPPDPLVHDVALPRLIDTFARHGVQATFFVLARDVPVERERLGSIHLSGHEVASHGMDHLPRLAHLTDDEIRTELVRSRDVLERSIGAPVVGFRAPDWSAGRRLVPALSDAGYRYDASLVPSPVLMAGQLLLAARARDLRRATTIRPPASLRRRPFRWIVHDRSVIEFPLAVAPRSRIPIYHTLRGSMGDSTFERHLDGFARDGVPLSYALHGVDALGLDEDGVDRRLAVHPGMDRPLAEKLELLERTIAAIACRFTVRTFAARLSNGAPT